MDAQHSIQYLSAQEQVEHDRDYEEWLAAVEENAKIQTNTFDEFDEYFDF